jgi:hypothetical protein
MKFVFEYSKMRLKSEDDHPPTDEEETNEQEK